jgi:hypothetical protein
VIRQMQTEDVPSVRRRAEVLAGELYPELISDIDRQNDLLQKAKGDPAWYARVVGEKGKPTAALVARVGDNVWASRQHAAIMLWYGTKGDGVRLLCDFREWVSSQKRIVLAGWCDDFGVDAQTRNAFLNRGFILRGGTFMFLPRGSKK